MTDILYMFLAEGVAGKAASKRAGARHALMIFVAADDLAAGQSLAVKCAERRGWLFVDLKRGKEVSGDVTEISDSVLRQAAQSAHDDGDAIVIYRDEITPNS